MSLTEYLSIPFLISLGITLLLVGIVGMFFTQRLQEQNHKINSVIGLVTTMAEEMNYLRAKTSAIPNFELSKQEGGNSEELVLVSDGEDDDDDDDESDDDESDEEEDEPLIESDEVLSSSQNIKLINIFNPLSNNEVEISNLDEIYEGEVEGEVEGEGDNDDDSDSESEEESVSNESVNLVELDSSNIDVNALDSSLAITDEKTISLDLNTVDYKKCSLSQLRNIVLEKGLSDDASKLKKNDLLKLLEG
jgi:hypothetical protein